MSTDISARKKLLQALANCKLPSQLARTCIVNVVLKGGIFPPEAEYYRQGLVPATQQTVKKLASEGILSVFWPFVFNRRINHLYPDSEYILRALRKNSWPWERRRIREWAKTAWLD